ncbi:phage/plasmid primase, P4 family [Segniliparus rotundus DSM 44985]|uniref:Phage/plasmid primase, P4 family n=1 Tax=Segniliparus rotundus (strain ATCC BAA-972 / CDC 1076 / CIP 108378 / DSM 44985 / JCM 13578) TaxID=640132 RepID=D6ZE05_SEGRD|nr:phage/plasmid primase, P4 family [Segniliparus rotundus]ADG97285.1 phage/plasmid primase, P4 family [Segniliparus rotundus DSM 44985]
MSGQGQMAGGAVAAPPVSSGGDGADGVVEFPPPSAPMRVARQLAKGYEHESGLFTLGHLRGDWLLWDGSMWAVVEQDELRSHIYRSLEHAVYKARVGKGEAWEARAFDPTPGKVSSVLDALRAVVLMDGGLDAPKWIGASGARRPPAGEVVACANGLLHVPSRTMIEHTPEFFTRTAVPFDYNPSAPEPKRWLGFLQSVWPGDADSVALLQEFFGYVLSGRTDMQKILLVVGPPRSGKGTIARVLIALVGKANAAAPTLASLGTNFGLSPLLGKPLAVVGDARLGGAGTRQVVERLLSISGEDWLTVDRKNKEPWTGPIPARFVIVSNELPRLSDASGAIAKRFVVLTMAQSFLGKEDHRLTADLLEELPGILAWSLDGLERLARNGSFTRTASSQDATRELEDLASPVAAFLREHCVIDPDGTVEKDKLYARWAVWCEQNGLKPTNSAMFGRDLRAAFPGLGDARPRNTGSKRPRHHVGIRLKTPKDNDADDDDDDPEPGATTPNPPGPPGPHAETPGSSIKDPQGAAWTVPTGTRTGPTGHRGGPTGADPTGIGKTQVSDGGPSGPSENPPSAPDPDNSSEQPEDVCQTCPNELVNPISRFLGQCPGCHRVTDEDRRRYFDHLHERNHLAG